MKKLLMVTMVLLSYVSYGQVIEKQTTYVLKMTEHEYSEYMKLKGQKQNSFKTPKNNFERIVNNKEGSFGAMGGVSSMIGNMGDFINFSGGGWIEYKNIGFEYIVSASVTDDIMANDYISGKVGKWIAGGSAKSFGVFYKRQNGLYYGGGIQTSLVLGLENVTTSYTYYDPISRRNVTTNRVTPTDINQKKTLPYVTIGYMKNLGDWFTFKGGVLISKFTSLNVGVGYSF
jgi:hypothetical protein